MSSIRFLFLPQEHDPDSFIRQQGKEVFLQAVEKAQPLHQYFVRQLYAQYGKHGAQKLIQEAQKILEPLEDGPGKELLIEELTRVTRLDPYRVRQWFNKKQAATKDTSSQQKTQNTPLRLSLALLVQQPELLQHIDKTLITDFHYPEPLQQVIKHLTQEPQLNTINLIERFRDSIYFDGLNKMVAFSHHIHPEQQQHTLNEIFQFLSKQFNNEQIEHLLQKLRDQGLSAEEKIHLQELLKAKHQTAKS
jgi:DNA primase